jgi:hypothetical protein
MFVKDKDELQHVSTLGSHLSRMAYLILSTTQVANIARGKSLSVREISYGSILFDSNFLI